MRSFNPNDINYGYCGHCHDFTMGRIDSGHVHDFVYHHDDYGSLADGGSYEVSECSTPECKARRYHALPD